MIKAIIQDWNSFWFSPASPRTVSRVRLCVCAACAAWFLSFWPSVDTWFGTDGILSAQTSAMLLQFDEASRWQTWSPLWWSESTATHYAFLLIGATVAVCVGFGVGGRIAIALLLAIIISWTHRIVWLSGPVEPALVAFVAYFLVDPGAKLFGSATDNSRQLRWQSGTTLRLIQTHCWILLAAGLLTQLASLVWWRGDGVWWLVSASRSTLLSPEQLVEHPMWVNGLTHAIVAFELLTLWLLLPRSTRPLGIVCGGIVCLAIGGIADYVLYATLLASGLVAFTTSIEPTKLGQAS